MSIPAVLMLFIISILIGGGLTYGILALQGHTNASAQKPLPPISLTPRAATTTGYSTPTPTAQTNQLPTPTSFQTISNADVGVSTKYPSDWTADPPQKNSVSAIFDVHPAQQNGIIVFFERYTSSTSATFKSTSDVNQVNLSQFQNIQGISNFQVIPSPTSQQTIGGAQWDQQDATFSNSNNVVFHITTFAVQYKHLYYDIVYSAPTDVYNEAVQKYFQPMLAAVKFLS
ncbi:MAG: hypothetical protein NVS3B14_21670 [Ktedonobacteraceae bacterium]